MGTKISGSDDISRNIYYARLFTGVEKKAFKFNGKNDLQIHETAMGTKVAPVYAVLALGYLEETLFVNENKYIQQSYFRYLDDIIITWKNKFGNYGRFINELNTLDVNLEFIIDKVETSMNFLYVTITKMNNNFETDIYYKQTDSKQYLNFNSNHPRHVKCNIPLNLAKHICTIVSKEENKKERLNELKNIY